MVFRVFSPPFRPDLRLLPLGFHHQTEYLDSSRELKTGTVGEGIMFSGAGTAVANFPMWEPNSAPAVFVSGCSMVVGRSPEGPRSAWLPLLEVLTFTLPVCLPHNISPLTVDDSCAMRVFISLLVLVATATSSLRLIDTI